MRLCDSCQLVTVAVFCQADSAFLCRDCDVNIHSANRIVGRHERMWMCEVCEEQPADVVCKQDAAALCRGCDAQIHDSNPLSGRHVRTPLAPFTSESEPPRQGVSKAANFFEMEEYRNQCAMFAEEEG
eukprot:CAMPEP_0182913986 /NCGR_PEP_ID=MMETSP0034_2-20130328/38320_1 /TAXON_ID=156128 /ORGANISM="Nephroselmis pyriformis, Strain CCMP717" /LENGTH=127 /DNA_ID=CAMNT_0025050715 /DNA_START=40 /DNA_END=419 /DNA_ORIENTATION=+